MSLLDSQLNTGAWTTVLIDRGPLAAPRYSYAPVQFLSNWDALQSIQKYPSGSIMMQWNGSSWQRWP